MAPEKNFKLLRYEHITYHFKVHDLEIPLIQIFSRNIQISRKYEQKQISRNFLKCSKNREILIFRKSNYISEISRLRASYNMFIFEKFEIFSGAIAELHIKLSL